MNKILFVLLLVFTQFNVFSQLSVFAGKDTTFCTGLSQSEHFIGSQLKITSGKPPYKYCWSLNYKASGIFDLTAKDFLTDTSIINPGFKNSFSNGEWVDISIKVTDSLGAKAEDIIRVRFSGFVYPMIDNVQYLNTGDSLQFSTYFIGGGIEPVSFVAWNPGKYLSDSLSLNTWCKPAKSQHYSAIVKDSAGCITYCEGYNIQVLDIKTGVVITEESDNTSCQTLLEHYSNESASADLNILIFTPDGKQIFTGNRKEETERFLNEKAGLDQLYLMELHSGKNLCRFKIINH